MIRIIWRDLGKSFTYHAHISDALASGFPVTSVASSSDTGRMVNEVIPIIAMIAYIAGALFGLTGGLFVKLLCTHIETDSTHRPR